MVKYAGIIAISCSISLFGMLKASSVKQHSRIRKEIINLLMHIESCISYSSMPIGQIYNSFRKSSLQISSFLDDLSNQTDILSVIDRHLDILSAQEKQKLFEFFSMLGKHYSSEEEVKLCRHHISFFKSIDESRDKDDKAKADLYKKLGIICGILAAIILI